MKKYFSTFLVVFVVAMAMNVSAFAAAKPTEVDAFALFAAGWGHAAKKNFFKVIAVKKTEGQTLNINGIQFYKMYVDVELQSIWGVVICLRSYPFDNSTYSLHMMRKGEYEKLSAQEEYVFRGLSEMGSSMGLYCSKVEKFGERKKILLKRVLVYEEFESGWKLSNLVEALQLELHEKYLVGDEADAEIKKMDGLQGAVARDLTGNNKTTEETYKKEAKQAEEARIREGRLLHIKESGVKLKDDITYWASTIVVLDKGTEVELVYIDQPNNPYGHKIQVRLKDNRKGWIKDEDVEEKVK